MLTSTYKLAVKSIIIKFIKLIIFITLLLIFIATISFFVYAVYATISPQVQLMVNNEGITYESTLVKWEEIEEIDYYSEKSITDKRRTYYLRIIFKDVEKEPLEISDSTFDIDSSVPDLVDKIKKCYGEKIKSNIK
jgi:hypothetical protein